MTEELNNQDLFNLEDNEPDSFEDDEFPDLPPLTFEREEEETSAVETTPPAPLAENAAATRLLVEKEPKKKKENKGAFAFLKKDEKETKTAPTKKTPKVKKEKPAPILRQKTTTESSPRALGPLFWSISGGIALLTALILLIVVIVVGVNAVKVTRALNDDLVASLHNSFVAMDEAHIKTTIPIEMEVPAQFELMLDTTTNVVLSEDTYISNATVSLNTGGLTINNAPTNIILPAGSELPIHLVLTVPVDEMIPVVMDVEVDIPMSETELHEPFTDLQKTIKPYYLWLWSITTPQVKTLPVPWEQ